MILAEVIGTVVAPVHHPSYADQKLLLLRPLRPDGAPRGRALVAIDRAHAGVGDRVLAVDEGSSVRDLLGETNAPVKTAVVGVVDFVEVDRRIVYDATAR
ncbi:MAG TPA: EutN/CcmL family microcompartment protein [Planctomycetota bacterium]|nr:EutN/CcmL family microcompartment protein [Planctomycetota bacterium]